MKVIDKKGIEISIAGKSYVFYSGEYNISIALSEANKEIFELIGKDFISGTIYFPEEIFQMLSQYVVKIWRQRNPYLPDAVRAV